MADRPLYLYGLLVVLFLLVGGVFLWETGAVYYVLEPDPDEYDRATVTAYDANGTELATVDVRIADTRDKRWLGLSDTEDLSMGEGMLFVHDSEGQQSYVMRDMNFSLDIVFVGSDERVTTIHHADEDAGGSFSGRAKWVLEVPRGWTNRTGLDEGDRVGVPDSI